MTRAVWIAVLTAACGDGAVAPLETAVPGVVFTYPSNAQVDVPLGTRIVVAFSEPVAASALGSCSGSGDAVTGGFCLVAPGGAVAAMADVTTDGNAVEIVGAPLDPGVTYAVYVRNAIDTVAQNLPASGPLFTFTTRTDRPRAAVPSLIAIDGADPAHPDAFRPTLDTSTIRLLFSEPLDPRSVTLAANSIQLLDAGGASVPATVITDGIHVSVDPVADLTGGATYKLQLGSGLVDLGGQPLAPITIPLTPQDTRGTSGPIPQVLRTRQTGDPGPATSRTGAAPNAVVIDKPLIGLETSTIQPSSIATELGDPSALGGPIAFTIRRGQRMALSGFPVTLGGTIPAGVTTGDIEIEFLTDSGGRLYRNPNQMASQRPENDRAPLYVDLSFDIAVYSLDPVGNAVLSQTVLGVQASGLVTATDGVLAIETMSSMELGLLGVTKAPTNLVLSLITDTTTSAPSNTTAPTLIATYPAANSSELPVDGGIELIFSEPLDLDKLRAGGLALETLTGTKLPIVIESAGAAVVVRSIAPLEYSTAYTVVLSDVEDVAGNKFTGATSVTVNTPPLATTQVPLTIAAIHPGVPCALTGGTSTSPGRCAGGMGSDDLYHPFSLPADESIAVELTQPPGRTTVVHGTACNAGSVRIEEVDATGACISAVPGTLVQHDHSFEFVPDQLWTVGTTYRLTVVSGTNKSCDAGEVCGINTDAASFDPLDGTSGNGDSGGPDLVVAFVGSAPDSASGSTFVFTAATPYTDVNGSGTVDGNEQLADANRAGLRITGTTGVVSDASFAEPDCDPSTPELEACMYLAGAMPVELGPLTMNCMLPDGTTAASCVPLTLSPQVMYATSITMNATAVISLSTDTQTTIMRIREPSGGPITGYIVDGGNGMPKLVVALSLYMDAPDLSITLSSHDLHSKELSLNLEGPLTFLPDGRLAIAASNVADVPVVVNIVALGGLDGSVQMILPKGEMKLQLVSPPLRGVER